MMIPHGKPALARKAVSSEYMEYSSLKKQAKVICAVSRTSSGKRPHDPARIGQSPGVAQEASNRGQCVPLGGKG